MGNLFIVENARPMGKGLQSPTGSVTDAELIQALAGYKRTVAGRYRAILREEIPNVLQRGDFHVSPKIDGELWFLILGDGEPFLTNPKGRVVSGNVPILKEAKKVEARAEGRTVFAGEFFAAKSGEGRPRVGDLSAAMSGGEKADTGRLGFAAFDLLHGGRKEEGVPFPEYSERYEAMSALLEGGKRLHAVRTKTVKSSDEVDKLYDEWVDKGKGEGIVVRTVDGRIHKIKPSINIDAAVIGYTERGDEPDQARSLLLALMREDGRFHLIGSCGNMPTEQRQKFMKQLPKMHTKSNYRHVSSDGALYHFLQPEIVIEIKVTDIQGEVSSGDPIERMVLSFEDNIYQPLAEMPGASIIHPIFQRVREDKSVNKNDVRLAQVLERCPIRDIDHSVEKIELPESTIVRREGYTKTMKGEVGVRKLVIWKTNKEKVDPRYPAFVVHYTDYSPNRKDPLKREVRLAPTEKAALAIGDSIVATNIKKGWALAED